MDYTHKLATAILYDTKSRDIRECNRAFEVVLVDPTKEDLPVHVRVEARWFEGYTKDLLADLTLSFGGVSDSRYLGIWIVLQSTCQQSDRKH